MVVKKLNDLCYYKKFIQIHLIHIKKSKHIKLIYLKYYATKKIKKDEPLFKNKTNSICLFQKISEGIN